MIKRVVELLKSIFGSKDRKKAIENSVIIIIIGIIVIIAGGSLFGKSDNGTYNDQKQNSAGQTVANPEQQAGSELEKRMAAILSQVEGVGRVNVMITYEASREIVPAYDLKKTESDTQEKDSGGGTRSIKQYDNENKIIFEESQGGIKKPFILKEIQPGIKGVVVVAEGSGDPGVRERISRAVQALTDVPVHRIQVLEYKK